MQYSSNMAEFDVNRGPWGLDQYKMLVIRIEKGKVHKNYYILGLTKYLVSL